MGCYVNANGSKEGWLDRNAKSRGMIAAGLTQIPEYSDFPEGTMPVILVDNGHFTAAGVAFCEEEYKAFTYPHPEDTRPRIIFEAKIDDLLKVSDLAEYIK
jgi:hypothetical protein